MDSHDMGSAVHTDQSTAPQQDRGTAQVDILVNNAGLALGVAPVTEITREVTDDTCLLDPAAPPNRTCHTTDRLLTDIFAAVCTVITQ